MTRPRLGALTALLCAAGSIGLVATPKPAQAAACCLSATAFGVGRLLIWEEFAVGLRTAHVSTLGRWDESGKWNSQSTTISERALRSDLWLMWGLSPRLSVYGQLPWQINHKQAGELSDTSVGLSDLQLGARYELVSIGEYLQLPGIALSAALSGPTGRATYDAKTILGTDVTGRGAWVLSAGVAVEETFNPLFTRAEFGVSMPLPQSRPDIEATQWLGASLQGTASAGWELVQGIVVSGLLRIRRDLATRIDGDTISASSKLNTGVALAASWRFDPHWTLQASIDSSLRFSSFGTNELGSLTSTLGLRYGYF